MLQNSVSRDCAEHQDRIQGLGETTLAVFISPLLVCFPTLSYVVSAQTFLFSQ